MKPTRHSKFDYFDVFCCLTILLLPFLLLWINSSWLFPKPNGSEHQRQVFIDRWIYVGFHLHLPELLKAFGGTYYASRVPWTILGWFLHRIFADEHALYVLHFSLFYLASVSLYCAIRNIFSNRAAAFATILVMGTQSYFLYAIGWDYVDGVSITCLLASFAALSSTAIRRHWRFSAITWGAAICMMVSTYILLVLFVPIEIGMFLLLNRFAGKRSVVAVGALAVSGGVAAALVLGLINWFLGGKFLYILGQINPLSAVAANRFRYDLPLARWVWTSPWLLLPTISFTFSCLFVLLHHKSVLQKLRSAGSALDWETSLLVCCIADLGASFIWLALEADHFYVLQIDYRANALLPFTFLVIGGAFAAMCKPLSRIRESGFLITLMAIALAPWILASFGRVFPREDLFQSNPILVMGWIIGGAALMALVVQWPYQGSGAATLIAFFSVVSVGAPTASFSFPPNPVYREETLAVFDASREVARYNSDARARFWFDLDEPHGGISGDIVSTYLYAYRLVNDAFPKLTSEDGKRASIAPGDRIILLTSKGDPVRIANAAVADQNIVFDQVAEIPIRRPGVAFTVVVADVKTDPSRPTSGVPFGKTPAPLLSEIPADADEVHDAFGPPLGPGSKSKVQGRFPVEVSTSAQPWAYGAQFPLQMRDLKGPLWIRIRASVEGGPVGIGVLNRDGSDFLSRVPVVASDDTTVTLSVPKPQQIGDLVIQTWDTGRPGNVKVEAITVLRPNSPVAERR